MRIWLRGALVAPILVLFQFIFVPVGLATTVDLSLNGDAFRIGAEWPIPNTDLLLDGAWLHEKDRGEVVDVGIQLTGTASGQGENLKAGVGGKLYFTDPKGISADGIALAPGGFVDFTFREYNRINLRGYLYFAPNVLSSSDLDQFYEVGAQVGYSVLKQGIVYLGVREVKAKYNGPANVTFDTGVHIGFRITF